VLEIEAATNQHCFAILPNVTWDATFLQFWLRSQYDNLRKLSAARGGSRSALSGAQLNALEVPTPELGDQQRIAAKLKPQLAEVDAARIAAQVQLDESSRLADAIVMDSVRRSSTVRRSLGEVLNEVKQGIGSSWAKYPVHGATRDGLAPARERPGKHAPKYKPVFPGTVFYNPMRILIGSIAHVDDDDAPGITSPDYVALQGMASLVDSRWFYYWLRSPLGVRCISTLARGAVRERMLFSRLADGEIDLPPLSIQTTASAALKELKPLRVGIEMKLQELNRLPQCLLAQAFEN
jgi:type I restriction enzyme S subunit